MAAATGLTLSTDQYNHPRALDLPGVEVRLEIYEDYRPAGKFSGIVSVGAFEHFTRPGLSAAEKVAVYRRFFERCHGWLDRRARLSPQSITWGNVPRDRTGFLMAQDVFPKTDPPYVADVLEASTKTFEPIFMENCRSDYVRTLQVWLERLRARQREIETMTRAETFDSTSATCAARSTASRRSSSSPAASSTSGIEDLGHKPHLVIPAFLRSAMKWLRIALRLPMCDSQGHPA